MTADKTFYYGSVCSGIEAATQAWEPLGWKPRFFSEVEPFPCAVLQQRYGASAPINALDPSSVQFSEAEVTRIEDLKAVYKKDWKKFLPEDLKERLEEQSTLTAWQKQNAKLIAEGVIPNEGDFTRIGDKYRGEIDCLVGGTPCFIGSTWIKTQGGRKRLEDVRPGDMVLTHYGRYRKVLRCGCKLTTDLRKLEFHLDAGTSVVELTGTPEHPFATGDPSNPAEVEWTELSSMSHKDCWYWEDAREWDESFKEGFYNTYVERVGRADVLAAIVYNIEVEEDHSYVANGIAVKNCQSYSVGGNRKGLNDPRGQLMLHFVGLARLSEARWTLWENVPGVLSQDGGEAFATLLSCLVGYDVKVPEGGWRSFGIVTGAPGCYGVAWRVFDVQFTRVDGFPYAIPQRRRRVFVVGCNGDWARAAEVLFEHPSVLGDLPPKRKTQTTVAESAGTGVDGSDGLAGPVDCRWYNGNAVADTIRATGIDQYMPDKGNCQVLVAGFLSSAGAGAGSIGYADGVSPTLRAGAGGSVPAVCCVNGHQNPVHSDDVALPVTCQDYGLSNVMCLSFDARGNNSDGVCATLVGDHPSRVTDYTPIAVFVESGIGYYKQTSVSGTLSTTEHQQQRTIVVTVSCLARRLMPVEVERLQGFPDDFTKISWNGKEPDDCPDGPRYKVCGNSMGVNCMRWIGARIKQVNEKYYSVVNEQMELW